MLELWKRLLTKFDLNCNDATIFVKSQWQKGSASLYYLLYRWTIMLVFFITWLLSVVDIKHLNQEALQRLKYLIYLTNWGYILCTFQAVLCTSMVSCWYYTNRTKTESGNDNCSLKLYKIYWVVNTIATDLAFSITIFYWSLIFDKSLNVVDARNLFLHGTNSVLMMIELIVEAHPIKWGHFYLPISCGIIYILFSVIYYLAGGTDEDGNTYIYRLLNWDKGGTATLMCLGVLVFFLAIHLFTYGIYRLRILAHKRCFGRSIQLPIAQANGSDINPVSKEDDGPNGVV